MKPKSARQIFEDMWRKNHRRSFERTNPPNWFERDDIWGRGGYAQPAVHYDWLYFKAGFMAARRVSHL